jgi:hypothetical protein
MNNIYATLILLLFAFPQSGSTQDSSNFEVSYEVNRVYESVVVTRAELTDATTLIDLNPHYKPSWIRSFISVEVSASHNGRTKKAVSKNDVLNQQQKNLMNSCDVGTAISVNVEYMPENTLKHNDPKTFNFSFMIDPDFPADYDGGYEQLKQYLKENAMDKIPQSSFVQHHLLAVNFTIDEEGQVIDVHAFDESKDEKTYAILLETIRKMPRWTPAEYADGTRVKQAFAFTVGDMNSCVVNLLHIRKY